MIRPANFYFIGIAVLQMVRQVSTSQGVPTMCLPLSFVIGVSMVKYAFEDYKRMVDDQKQNNKVYTKLRVRQENDPELSMLSPGAHKKLSFKSVKKISFMYCTELWGL